MASDQDRKVALGLWAVFVTQLVSFLLINARSIAQPVMIAEFDGMALFPWLIALPALSGAVGTLLSGKLSDMYGRRAVLLASIIGPTEQGWLGEHKFTPHQTLGAISTEPADYWLCDGSSSKTFKQASIILGSKCLPLWALSSSRASASGGYKKNPPSWTHKPEPFIGKDRFARKAVETLMSSSINSSTPQTTGAIHRGFCRSRRTSSRPWRLLCPCLGL